MMVRKRQIEVKTNYGSHICTIEPDEEKGGFIVTANYLPGVITWGKNVKHARAMAKEAIELCIECLAEENFVKTKNYTRRVPASIGA